MEIRVRAGHGGRGAASFRREPFIPRGGPDGGDGGRGGSVTLVADPGLSSLEGFAHKRSWSAGDGQAGAGARKEGRSGTDLVLRVPVGTVVTDAESGEVVADLDRAEAQAVIARGGLGGRGNVHFATPARRAPKFSEPGIAGEERQLRLELKLIADAGLVGAPNAGKSSLLRAVSAARPKVGAYAFTTLEPMLGVAECADGTRVTFADIPGLIEGAAQGAGLGLDFLRHVERTRVLVYVLDGSAADPWSDLAATQREIRTHSAALGERPSLTVVNKIDLPAAQRFRQAQTKPGIHYVSALTGEGVPQLIESVAAAVRTAPPPLLQPEPVVPRVKLRPARTRETPAVFKRSWGFEVQGPAVERLVERTDFKSEEALQRFQVQLDRLGVSRELEAAGAAAGDTVRIGQLEFEYQP